jgi:uncharacterized protein
MTGCDAGRRQMLELGFDGKATLVPLRNTNINASDEGGINNPCAGTTTPWCTHIGAEEATIDGRPFEATYLQNASTPPASDVRYYAYYGGGPTIAEYRAKMSPYQTGWKFECLQRNGVGECNKLWSAGRSGGEVSPRWLPRGLAQMA